ncbi:hypothetical protein BC937DRAFT_89614 [Endogone sp. FLAS-F59071]|nr:hypothetical protein BC937DRAFT_89614 [Endogone sp. FLAS-F59071]|eukprot:RUS17688.1 hypothetical protein BC937DRAFT_89614 [Endogone sp. FLAS-F59071]
MTSQDPNTSYEPELEDSVPTTAVPPNSSQRGQLTRSDTSISVLHQREEKLKEDIDQLRKETEELSEKDEIIKRNIGVVHEKLEKEVERKREKALGREQEDEGELYESDFSK